MTTTVPFVFVDVFASEPLTGNPLALVPNADGRPVERMRAIAKEFNQSETTFLVRPTRPGATWRLRSFTPIGVEVLGAGHNAMGAWIWLADSGRLPAREEGSRSVRHRCVRAYAARDPRHDSMLEKAAAG
jgi:PhzF family phenazine biosynthesis protein